LTYVLKHQTRNRAAGSSAWTDRRKGAALNAVQIAETLINRRLIAPKQGRRKREPRAINWEIRSRR
jgi:hypothetical protein